MLLVMRSMFPNKQLNAGLAVAFVMPLIAAFWMGWDHVFPSNEQFLRSMIPHHSRAVLVCEEAANTDSKNEYLSGKFIQLQEEEITIMNEMLGE